MNTLKTNLLLLLTALIWGLAFVAQQMGMDYIEPFTFNCLRFLIGVVVLIPVIWFLNRRQAVASASGTSASRDTASGHFSSDKKTLYMGAFFCGVPLAFASAAQQVALVYSPAGKVGFLTALYILVVPILGLFLKKRIRSNIWIGVFIAVIGMYLLCITDGFSIGKGDAYGILCAFIYAFQILAVDYFSPKVDGLRLSCLEFLVAGILNGIIVIFTETPELSGILSAAVPLLYTGILSCGVAYTLQVIAQKDADPTVAALIMSLESVFSVIGGWLILNQVMSPRETLGCVLMFAAIILAQLPGKTRQTRQASSS